MMTGPVLGRAPTCLSCTRRLSLSLPKLSGTSPYILLQTRGKKTSGRPKDQGVAVRLLEDVPKFGRKDAIFRVDRGRMRNIWYPNKKAEYMTATRFQELGLTREDMGERDPVFGINAQYGDDKETTTAAVEVEHVDPVRSHEILASLLPETITFFRKPIPQTAQPIDDQVSAVTGNTLAIFGSVSRADIVHRITTILKKDAEASRVTLNAEGIRFTGLQDIPDKIKTLGQWEIEICAANATGAGQILPPAPVRKIIEVLADTGDTLPQDSAL